MKTIASQEYEWTTRHLMKAKSGQYFIGVQNGGWNGAYQPRDGDRWFWHEPLTKIDADEAEAVAMEMGVEL